jgi:pimeloyl-ACP methyl ester carboxylesterase
MVPRQYGLSTWLRRRSRPALAAVLICMTWVLVPSTHAIAGTSPAVSPVPEPSTAPIKPAAISRAATSPSPSLSPTATSGIPLLAVSVASAYGGSVPTNPWQGSPDTNFVGQLTSGDASAILLTNSSSTDMSITDVSVTMTPGTTFDLWGSSLTVPAHGFLILTETAPGNFDTDDFSSCTNPPLPVISVVSTIGAQTFFDRSLVLDTDVNCGASTEFSDWRVAAENTVRPLIFIPGVGGSSLFLEQGSQPVPTVDGSLFDPKLAPGTKLWVNKDVLQQNILNISGTLGQLRFSPTSTPQPLVPGVSARHNELYTDAGGYGDVVPFFQRNGYVLDSTLFIVTYDWRASVESHVAEVEAAVRAALNANPGADGVDIVAHSMGTLVTRAFLTSGDPTLRARVKHVVLLGGPQLGTPNGSNALIFGECLTTMAFLHGFLKICPISEQDLQFVFRTLPGGADLAMSPQYYTFFDGSDAQHPLPFVDTRTAAEGGIPGSDYARLRQEETLNQTTPANLDGAEAFHSNDLTWLSDLPSLGVTAKVSIVVGTGQPTMGQIREVFVPNPVDPQRPGTRAFDYVAVDGDGTVTRQSASLEDSAKGIQDHGAATVYYRPFVHGDLVAQGKGLDLALRLVDDDPTVETGTPQPPSGAILSVHSPMQMLVTDSSGRRVGAIGDTTFEEVPGATYQQFGDMKLVMLPPSGTYSASFVGTDTGQAVIRLRELTSGTVSRSAVFLNVPTTSAAKASMTFDAATGVTSAITDDVNGNGTNVQTIEPNQLSGPAAQEQTGPSITNVSPTDGGTIVAQGGPSTGVTVPVSWQASDALSGLNSSFAVLDAGTAIGQVLPSPTEVVLDIGTHSLDIYSDNKAGVWTHVHTTFQVVDCGSLCT